MVETAGAWSLLLLPPALGLVALGTATFDAVLGAAYAGRGVRGEWRQPLRGTARLLVKQRRTTLAPDGLLWRLGGGGVVVVACVASIVVPLGRWSVADLSIGVVWWTAFMAVLWALLHMVGYSANAPYPMVAAYRFLAQAMAYEMPLAISVITVAVAGHSLQVGRIIAAQHGLWYGVWMPVAFGTYLVCVLALSFYGPFANPTAPDLGGGVLAELAGIDRLVVLAGRYVVLASAAGFGTALFLGGGAGPLLPAWLWTLLKTAVLLAFLVGARWRWPLVRVERFEEFAWVVLLPASIAQTFVVCIVVL